MNIKVDILNQKAQKIMIKIYLFGLLEQYDFQILNK